MLQKEPQILYEDNDIIVCVKPAGVPAQADRTGAYDLTSQLLNHLAAKKQQSGIPYLAIIHRLDRPVGGVMVFAKSQKAAANLSRQVQEHRMTKRYYCVLTGYPGAGNETGAEPGAVSGATAVAAATDWQSRVDYLVSDKRTNLSRIAGQKDKDAKKAELRWRVLEQIVTDEAPAGQPGGQEVGSRSLVNTLTLAEVELLTGRHHQIRVQMTRVAEGLWGDTKYNPAFTGKKGWYELALFSHELQFVHPVTGKRMHFDAVPGGISPGGSGSEGPGDGVFGQFAYIQRLRDR